MRIMIWYLTVIFASIPAVSFAADDIHRAAIAARLENIQNISAEFDTVTEDTPIIKEPSKAAPRGLAPGIVTGDIVEGTSSQHDSISFLSGLVLVDSVMSPETVAKHANDAAARMTHEVVSLSSGRAEVLRWYAGRKSPVATILRTKPISEEWTLDLALGLRLYREQRYLRQDDLQNLKVISVTADKVEVLLKDTPLRHVLEFDPRIGYALVRYTVADPNGNVFETFDCSDFKRFGNVMLPMSVVRRNLCPDSKGQTKPSCTWTVRVRNYVIPDAVNTPDRFLLSWPKGVTVLDARIKFQLPATTADQKWEDEKIFAEVKKHDEAEARLNKVTEQRIQKALSGAPGTSPATNP